MIVNCAFWFLVPAVNFDVCVLIAILKALSKVSRDGHHDEEESGSYYYCCLKSLNPSVSKEDYYNSES